MALCRAEGLPKTLLLFVLLDNGSLHSFLVEKPKKSHREKIIMHGARNSSDSRVVQVSRSDFKVCERNFAFPLELVVVSNGVAVITGSGMRDCEIWRFCFDGDSPDFFGQCPFQVVCAHTYCEILFGKAEVVVVADDKGFVHCLSFLEKKWRLVGKVPLKQNLNDRIIGIHQANDGILLCITMLGDIFAIKDIRLVSSLCLMASGSDTGPVVKTSRLNSMKIYSLVVQKGSSLFIVEFSGSKCSWVPIQSQYFPQDSKYFTVIENSRNIIILRSTGVLCIGVLSKKDEICYEQNSYNLKSQLSKLVHYKKLQESHLSNELELRKDFQDACLFQRMNSYNQKSSSPFSIACKLDKFNCQQYLEMIVDPDSSSQKLLVSTCKGLIHTNLWTSSKQELRSFSKIFSGEGSSHKFLFPLDPIQLPRVEVSLFHFPKKKTRGTLTRLSEVIVPSAHFHITKECPLPNVRNNMKLIYSTLIHIASKSRVDTHISLSQLLSCSSSNKTGNFAQILGVSSAYVELKLSLSLSNSEVPFLHIYTLTLSSTSLMDLLVLKCSIFQRLSETCKVSSLGNQRKRNLDQMNDKFHKGDAAFSMLNKFIEEVNQRSSEYFSCTRKLSSELRQLAKQSTFVSNSSENNHENSRITTEYLRIYEEMRKDLNIRFPLFYFQDF